MSTCIPGYFQTVWYEPDKDDVYQTGHSLLLRLTGEIDTELKRIGFDPEEYEQELIEFEHVYQPRSECMLKGFTRFPPAWERLNNIVAYKELPCWKAILKSNNDNRTRTVGAALSRTSEIVHMVKTAEKHFELLWLLHWKSVLIKLIEAIFRRKPEFGETDLQFMLEHIIKSDLTDQSFFKTHLLGIIQIHVKKYGLSQNLQSLLLEIREMYYRLRDIQPFRGIVEKISGILGEPEIFLDNKDVWAEQSLSDLSSMETSKKVKWERILSHAYKSSRSRPAESWLLRADELLKTLGEREFEETIIKWLEKALITVYLPKKSREGIKKLEEIPEHLFRDYVKDKKFRGVYGWPVRTLKSNEIKDDCDYKDLFIETFRKNLTCRWRFSQRNSSVLKGLIWFCGLLRKKEMMRIFYSLAKVCYELDCADVAVSTAAGNACFYLLGEANNSESKEYLLKLKTEIKNRAALKAIEKILIRKSML